MTLVVYAGTMGAINGVGFLVEVARAALDRGADARFIVVGRGAEEEAIRSRAEASGVLGQNFFMYAPVSKAMMPSVLAAADISLSLFVDLEPMWANSANKFFDGLASGTPVGINYGGWQAELLTEAGAGIVLPATAAGLAADMILDRLADQEWLVSSGKRARQLAEERFGRDELAGQLERVLIDSARERQ